MGLVIVIAVNTCMVYGAWRFWRRLVKAGSH